MLLNCVDEVTFDPVTECDLSDFTALTQTGIAPAIRGDLN
jgi:hypothetical protein